MTRLAPAALVTVLAAAAPASPAAAQSGLPTGRPHSKVVTDDRGDLRITALQMTVTRAGRRLRARVALAVRNESARSVRRELRIGCTGGEPANPVCPATATIPVPSAGAGRSTSFGGSRCAGRPPAPTPSRLR